MCDKQAKNFVAVGLMQVKIIRGLQCGFPWTSVGFHAITRCVEGDIRMFKELKILQSEDDPATVGFIKENFQLNLTERGWKESGFEFDIVLRNKKCALISLSGREAITGNAGIYKFAEAGVQHELFEGIFY